MTDPSARRPEYWRNFAWLFTAVTALNLVGGVILVIVGSASGWINVALGLIFTTQTVMYFRHWRKARRELEGGQRA
ncbi:hypothetical protein ACFVWR_07020 [Leifsonia sp. NPDC058292]|uniref:hypothetical protein n=1 Tax=Leifsonia sp. NPDC058292 TaxID=3346428 RepID=UPI0036DA6780